ncbi:hypothetical protein COV93_02735 [Candidatus Woesearchaeota archaeon CG11_big_fil_rev_8_21_14_0_20_43_8]|nr:MAG: hypothetical protein COV93_02735 [Candidatus Woesearchaeota archaeon CG11_big_fil_rev_8_21_14_0_20_43_8]PIO05315.1 MAG: hypothetical protein COT47_05325 [Candidatus Woesearchaeota archaeon CG08_land_8_20_14_0_20_43_7]
MGISPITFDCINDLNVKALDKKYAPFLRYSRITKHIEHLEQETGRTKEIKRLEGERQESLEKTHLLLEEIVDEFVQKTFGVETPHRFAIKEPTTWIDVCKKYEQKLFKEINLHKKIPEAEKRKIRREYAKKGMIANIEELSGLSGDPLEITDREFRSYCIISAVFHEITHNYQELCRQPVWEKYTFSDVEDPKIVSESTAELIGMQATDCFINSLPKSSRLSKKLRKEKADLFKKFNRLKIGHGHVMKFLDLEDYDGIEEYIEMINENKFLGQDVNFTYFISRSRYLLNTKFTADLEEIMTKCNSLRLFTDITGMLLSYDDLKYAVQQKSAYQDDTIYELKKDLKIHRHNLFFDLFENQAGWINRLSEINRSYLDIMLIYDELLGRDVSRKGLIQSASYLYDKVQGIKENRHYTSEVKNWKKTYTLPDMVAMSLKRSLQHEYHQSKK